jgi:hypothetical protein
MPDGATGGASASRHELPEVQPDELHVARPDAAAAALVQRDQLGHKVVGRDHAVGDFEQPVDQRRVVDQPGEPAAPRAEDREGVHQVGRDLPRRVRAGTQR